MNTRTQRIMMDTKTANELGGALQRVAELESKSIIESGDAAEKRALQNFIATNTAVHAAELVGCWFTVEQEYRPLLASIATVLGHAGSIIQRRQQIMQQPVEKKGDNMVPPAPAPSNVVPLVQPGVAAPDSD